MVDVMWSPTELPTERHIVVRAHRDQAIPTLEKGYFYDSAERDHGGSGPFDWRLAKAIDRAKQRAFELGLRLVVILPAEVDRA